ncbi:taurine ABC transporter substrate-binding protein [Bifidobacterium catulorum]|uniref:Glycine/betaine ABC transporter substrate-binding protein n=1 Tax=Bifidobacterium catulorum TaxID=1630173 RepID=A0A2U2MQ91_9BIFI|nr:ABC transporter substrate-binding protein [Bifidobacterium catulorum]PWG58999.1 glycine/betaine ABC transporter substrate-binding protein [Bifidobacterium catulorum]
MSLGLGNEVTRKALSMLAVGAAVLSMAACGQMKTADELAGNTSNAGNSGTAASSCPTDVNNDFTGTIRVGWQAIPNADLVVKDQKLLENCLPKATIKWSQFNSGADVLQAFGAKSLDIALLGSSPSVKAVSAPLDLPVQVVWINDVIGEAESLVTRDSGVSSIRDLRGKTIAVPFGSTSHFSLLSALSDAGLNDSDVKLVNLDPDKMPAAWQRGEIDAAWVWDPVLGELKASGGKTVTSSAETAKTGAPTYDLELATSAFVKANPDVLTTWTAVENHAVGQVRDGDASAIDSIAVQLNEKPDQVRTQVKGYSYLTADDQEKSFEQLPDVFSKTAKFLKSQAGVDSVKGSYDSAFHADAIKEVAAK